MPLSILNLGPSEVKYFIKVQELLPINVSDFIIGVASHGIEDTHHLPFSCETK